MIKTKKTIGIIFCMTFLFQEAFCVTDFLSKLFGYRGAGVPVTEKVEETLLKHGDEIINGAIAVGESTARALGADAVKEGGKIAQESLPDVIEGFKEVGVETAKNIGLEATKEVIRFSEKYVVPIAWTGVGLYAVATTYSMACDIKDRCDRKPIIEEQKEACAKHCKLLKAERKLREKLAKHFDEKPGKTSLPAACDEAAKELYYAGGTAILGQIVIDYKNWFLEYENTEENSAIIA